MTAHSDENKQAPAPGEVRRDPYGVHILRRDTSRALEPRKGMVVGLPKVVIDASHAAHALAAYDALKARVRELEGALRAVIDSIPTPEFYTNVNQARATLSKERT